MGSDYVGACMVDARTSLSTFRTYLGSMTQESPLPITASQLRADVYRLLDRAIETGEPLEIERNGVIVRLVPPRAAGWFDRLPRRPWRGSGDIDELDQVSWTEAWSPDLP